MAKWSARIRAVVKDCPLCERLCVGASTCENSLAVAFDDAYPISPGHTLIVSRRHVDGFFDLTDEEQHALWSLVPRVKEVLTNTHRPAAYNVGLNVGKAAGQTVPHVHVHVIPRYPGDVPDPRGGIRWVLPERAAYWSDR